ARTLIAQGKEAEAREALENVAASGPLAEEADRLRGLVELHGLAPKIDEAAARHRIEAEPKSAQARYELGCVLAASGRYADALAMLLSAAELDPGLARSKVREAMVKVFQVVGVRSALADEYRAKLQSLLY